MIGEGPVGGWVGGKFPKKRTGTAKKLKALQKAANK